MAEDLGQVVIGRQGQHAGAAAEVDGADRRGQVRVERVRQDLDEAFDLAMLGAGRRLDAPVLVGDPDRTQERRRLVEQPRLADDRAR